MKTKCVAVVTFLATLVLALPSAWCQEEAVFSAKETVLVVVDMQNDFAAPGGVFASDRSMKVVEKIKTVIEKARQAGVPIIYTQDYHKPADWELRVGGRIPHAMEGTSGAEILEVLKPRKADFVVKKNSFDPWFSNGELSQILNRSLKNIRYAVVVGLLSDVCVYGTANGFGIRGYNLVLPKDCTESRDDYGRDLFFRQMTMLYGARLTDSEKLKFR
jgi:nicotinamidase-related amidase